MHVIIVASTRRKTKYKLALNISFNLYHAFSFLIYLFSTARKFNLFILYIFATSIFLNFKFNFNTNKINLCFNLIPNIHYLQ